MKLFKVYTYLSILCLLGVLSFGITFQGYGQYPDFEERYYQVYKDIIALDTKEALRIADSLLTVADSDIRKMRALLLTAEIHKNTGDMPSSLYAVLKAQKIANSIAEFNEWQALTSGFLATTFREVGLTEQSKTFLKQAEIANERKRDVPGYMRRRILMQHEKASHAAADSSYRYAIDLLSEGSALLKNDSHPSARLLAAINDQLMASYLLELNQLDSAEILLASSLAILEQKEDSNKLRPYIYREKSELSIRRGQYDSAYNYLQLTQPYIESVANEELKLAVYLSYIKYYSAKSNMKEVLRYHNLHQETDLKRQETAKRIWNELLRKLDEENQGYQSNLAIGWRIFITTMGVFCLLLAFVWLKRRNEKAKYLLLIEKLKLTDAAHSTAPPHDLIKKEHLKLHISPETENLLKNDLESLEKTGFFLDKDVSLASLALQLNTNQRYASFIIRKYKDMDFNSYIHHYRIHHIIDRINNEPELLDYKLAYLADIAGFSSHSKFSAVFKAVTGISPSVFIRYAKNDSTRKMMVV